MLAKVSSNARCNGIVKHIDQITEQQLCSSDSTQQLVSDSSTSAALVVLCWGTQLAGAAALHQIIHKQNSAICDINITMPATLSALSLTSNQIIRR